MNKLEFINALGGKLSSLPTQEVQGILDYYVESIADRMEDGMTEEEAIESLGSVDELAEKILAEQTEQAELPVVSEPPKKRRFSPGIIVLLILGSPIWISIGAALFAAFLGIYIAVWAVLGSLLVSAGAFVLAGIVSAPFSFFVTVIPDTLATRVLSCGVCLGLAGLGLILLPLCLKLVLAFAKLHRWVFRKITRKGEKS